MSPSPWVLVQRGPDGRGLLRRGPAGRGLVRLGAAWSGWLRLAASVVRVRRGEEGAQLLGGPGGARGAQRRRAQRQRHRAAHRAHCQLTGLVGTKLCYLY